MRSHQPTSNQFRAESFVGIFLQNKRKLALAKTAGEELRLLLRCKEA